MSNPSHSDGRIVAIGGSAGAIEALRTIVARLPAELGAPILVTIHVPADATSALPLILSRSGPLPAAHGVDGERVRPGRIYVAPPDRHMSVEDHVLRLSRSPRANGHRPSVDVMFQGVARTFGPHALGIVLSGGLRDGAAGLAVIVGSGGDGIVQDPSEAIVSSMPTEALSASAATVLPAREIAGAIERFADVDGPRGSRPASPVEVTMSEIGERPGLEGPGGTPLDHEQPDVSPAGADLQSPRAIDRGATVFSCPACGGVLSEHAMGPTITFRCRVGHAYGPDALEAAEAERIEESLWAAVRALEEHADLSMRLATRADGHGLRSAGDAYRSRARESQRRALILRRLVEREADEGSPGSA